jgi:hypothetical protein
VAAGRVHEELQGIEGAARRGRQGAGLRGGIGAHDDVALVERGLQRGEVVLAELVLVGKRRELLFVDETALGGLLDEALGRREVVQVNRVAQWNPFRRGGAACGAASLASGGAGVTRDWSVALCEL